jgi:hypothetical protein
VRLILAVMNPVRFSSQARYDDCRARVNEKPAEDSALRLGAERRAGVVPGLGGKGILPAAR